MESIYDAISRYLVLYKPVGIDWIGGYNTISSSEYMVQCRVNRRHAMKFITWLIHLGCRSSCDAVKLPAIVIFVLENGAEFQVVIVSIDV